LFIAYDTTRFWSTAFIFILIFPRHIIVNRNGLLALIAIANLLIPTFYFGWDWMAPLDKPAVAIYQKVKAKKRGAVLFKRALVNSDIKLLSRLLSP
jgi:hypothetical protein